MRFVSRDGPGRRPLAVLGLVAALAGCAPRHAAWQSLLNASEPGGRRMAVAYQRNAGGTPVSFDFQVVVYPDSVAALADREGRRAWDSYDVPAVALRWGAKDSLIVTVEASERTSHYARSIRRHPVPRCHVFTRELTVVNPSPPPSL